MSHSFLYVSDKTEHARILFVSRAVRDALRIEPDELIGCRTRELLHDEYPLDSPFSEAKGCASLGAVMMFVSLNDRDGNPVHSRIISIDCGDCTFSIARTVDMSDSHTANEEERARKLENECSSSSSAAAPQGRPSRRRTHVYTSRAPPAKACFVLEGDKNRWDAHGPRITFVTNTISSLIDVDGGYEIIGQPFLSIVAAEDITRVSEFLDRLIETEEPEVLTFRILASPMDPDNNEHVRVIALGAGSSDGSLLLCRAAESPVQPLPGRNNRRAECGYMSLEDIISSDPDTSDCSEVWRELV
ncbi:hypothetical protein GQ54DRAFT_313220 [Martensiomyces pterosporus]|nr:hypothetical protein GQ54DRAFT_313220 [Martensiomyces pterosporus]